jgi:hypothetical protein
VECLAQPQREQKGNNCPDDRENKTNSDSDSTAEGALPAVLLKSPMPAASKALALEYAPDNIRFKTVSPGLVKDSVNECPIR